MTSRSSWRSRAFVIAILVLLGALAVPAAATADVVTFHRFEVDAIANYTVTETCPDGSTSTTRVSVIAGHEEEAESGVTTLDNDRNASKPATIIAIKGGKLQFHKTVAP